MPSLSLGYGRRIVVLLVAVEQNSSLDDEIYDLFRATRSVDTKLMVNGTVILEHFADAGTVMKHTVRTVVDLFIFCSICRPV